MSAILSNLDSELPYRYGGSPNGKCFFISELLSHPLCIRQAIVLPLPQLSEHFPSIHWHSSVNCLSLGHENNESGTLYTRKLLSHPLCLRQDSLLRILCVGATMLFLADVAANANAGARTLPRTIAQSITI